MKWKKMSREKQLSDFYCCKNNGKNILQNLVIFWILYWFWSRLRGFSVIEKSWSRASHKKPVFSCKPGFTWEVRDQEFSITENPEYEVYMRLTQRPSEQYVTWMKDGRRHKRHFKRFLNGWFVFTGAWHIWEIWRKQMFFTKKTFWVSKGIVVQHILS